MRSFPLLCWGRGSALCWGRRWSTCRPRPARPAPPRPGKRGRPGRSRAVGRSWGRSSRARGRSGRAGSYRPRPLARPPHRKATGWTRSQCCPERWLALPSPTENKQLIDGQTKKYWHLIGKGVWTDCLLPPAAPCCPLLPPTLLIRAGAGLARASAQPAGHTSHTGPHCSTVQYPPGPGRVGTFGQNSQLTIVMAVKIKFQDLDWEK